MTWVCFGKKGLIEKGWKDAIISIETNNKQ